jgi:tRNA dimethylallyltransferase
MPEKKLVVVAGPTAVGKTTVSIQLATFFSAAIVSADSRQIYRELTIGTAKPSPGELAEVPHYFIDSHTIKENYDAARYGEEALNVIEQLFREKDCVILCGGSGLYIKAVCEGFDAIPEVPEGVRSKLVEKYKQHGLGWLREQMQQLDPEALQLMDEKNPHRLIRALEVKIASGESITAFRKKEKRKHAFDIVKIGLELPREELYRRIDERMDQMIAEGLFDEAKELYPFRNHNALQTVGYQEIFGFMENEYDYEECVRLLKRNSRRYAKRQLTWFKRDNGFGWFHPQAVDLMVQYINNPLSHVVNPEGKV